MVKLNTQKTINDLETSFLKTDLPVLRIGDNVKVGVKIIEGDKERVQFYEGTIIARKNSSINTTITVRKVLQGIGVERIFLIHSPKIDSITVLRSSKMSCSSCVSTSQTADFTPLVLKHAVSMRLLHIIQTPSTSIEAFAFLFCPNVVKPTNNKIVNTSTFFIIFILF